jgi:Cysteine-rich secretory protein family
VGIESRDWYRDGAKKRQSPSLLPWLIGAVIVVAGLFAASPGGQRALGLDNTHVSAEHRTHQDIKISLLPGTPAITIHRAALYAADDPWRGYLANERTCPGGERTDLPLDQQVEVMLCLIDWARLQRGLSSPTQTTLLTSTALQKGNEIVRCHNFAHAPCGGDPADDTRAIGYRGAWGENLYIAGGRYGAPRVALDGWLNSPGHRENLFRPEWQKQGIAVIKLDQFGPYHPMTLWVSHFGSE